MNAYVPLARSLPLSFTRPTSPERRRRSRLMPSRDPCALHSLHRAHRAPTFGSPPRAPARRPGDLRLRANGTSPQPRPPAPRASPAWAVHRGPGPPPRTPRSTAPPWTGQPRATTWPSWPDPAPSCSFCKKAPAFI